MVKFRLQINAVPMFESMFVVRAEKRGSGVFPLNFLTLLNVLNHRAGLGCALKDVCLCSGAQVFSLLSQVRGEAFSISVGHGCANSTISKNWYPLAWP